MKFNAPIENTPILYINVKRKWSDFGINRVKGQQLYNSKYCIKVKIDNYFQTKDTWTS